MSEYDDETVEPSDDEPHDAGGHPAQPKGRRLSFGKVRRELTEDELSSSGVQKMLLDELDRMDGAETELKSVSENYHKVNTELEVSREKQKTHSAFDVISTGTVAAGSLLFGAAFSVENNEQSVLGSDRD